MKLSKAQLDAIETIKRNGGKLDSDTAARHYPLRTWNALRKAGIISAEDRYSKTDDRRYQIYKLT